MLSGIASLGAMGILRVLRAASGQGIDIKRSENVTPWHISMHPNVCPLSSRFPFFPDFASEAGAVKG